jgi:HEPN domain-containing protein
MLERDARRYWRIAGSDLQEARRMWELSGFRSSSIGFLLQQAAEKSLKGWIQAAGGEAPFTHDLGALLDLLQEMGEEPAGYDSITELNFFAVQSRYDDELEMQRPDWPAWFAVVEGLYRKVERRLEDL